MLEVFNAYYNARHFELRKLAKSSLYCIVGVGMVESQYIFPRDVSWYMHKNLGLKFWRSFPRPSP